MRMKGHIIIFTLLIFQFSLYSQDPVQESAKKHAASILSSRGEVYLAIPVSQRKSFSPLIPQIAPDKTDDSLVYFYANAEEFRLILNSGVKFKLLTAPSMLAPVKMAENQEDALNGQGYATYQQYLDIMKKFSEEHPDLCKIDTIGYSISNKLILSARIQKGTYEAGSKPLVFFSSTMHGDEPAGYVLMLMLINDILANADNSSRINTILDNLVLVINPLSNPDGTFFLSDTSLFGATRYNKNNIDLNRDFPDIRLGMDYSTDGLAKENLAMVRYMEKYPPSLSANFHGGAEVLNYPWDTWYSSQRLHADNDWFIEICKDYVDTARNIDPDYLNTFTKGYVFGSDWYWIPGGRQDFVTYNLRGREITIELSNLKIPDASELPGLWEKNHSALLNLVGKAIFGVHGFVRDSITMKPLKAKIDIPGYDKDESDIFSNISTGKFFRFLPEGNYNLKVSAEGYRSKYMDVEVIKNQPTFPDLRLRPFKTEILVKQLTESNEIIVELSGDDSEAFYVDLYDFSGRKVQEKIFIGNSGIIGGLNLHGIYILKVRSDIQNATRLVFFNNPF